MWRYLILLAPFSAQAQMVPGPEEWWTFERTTIAATDVQRFTQKYRPLPTITGVAPAGMQVTYPGPFASRRLCDEARLLLFNLANGVDPNISTGTLQGHVGGSISECFQLK